MTTYVVELGADRVAWMTDTGSPIGCAGILDHVAGPDDSPSPDSMVFDGTVAAVLRDLPSDVDGHLDDEGVWFGGVAYPVTVASS